MSNGNRTRPTLHHLPLEPYAQRYTEMLSHWEQAEFGKKWAVQTYQPSGFPTLMDVRTGRVLDRVQRSVWSLGQMAALVPALSSRGGHVWLSDFFTPGLEALAYMDAPVKVNAFCWAQTFDRFDFTREMLPWMRSYEEMACAIYDKVFVASTGLADRLVTVFPWMTPKVRVVGLPFNSQDVFGRCQPADIPSFKLDVVYTSRWDTEKKPGVFLDLVVSRPDLKFGVCTGWDCLRGTDAAAIGRAETLARNGQLRLLTGLTRSQYYGVLNVSKVQFNCALQDWVSFTLLEALTFGCHPLYPNHRSFPEALNYSEANLYMPGSIDSALEKLDPLLKIPGNSPLRLPVLEFHDHTLSRISHELQS